MKTTPNNYKPILFSTEMVQAILAGRKTQTRRIVKIDNTAVLEGMYSKNRFWNSDVEMNPNPLSQFLKFKINESETDLAAKIIRNDILWVRETWQNLDTEEIWGDEFEEDKFKICYTYKATNDLRPNGVDPEKWDGNWALVSEEKFDIANEKIETEEVEGRDIWYPSIYMPKEACRIFLKVTNVSCERLNDISDEDAIAEGVEMNDYTLYKNYLDKDSPGLGQAKFSFLTLWDSINAKKATWKSNPWVWVYEFEKVEKPADFI